MRILHVNKFLYRRGGAESYMLDLAELQRAAGHEVEFFAMQHPDNLPARYAGEFPSLVELDPPPSNLADKLRAAGRILYSTSAARGIARTVEDFRPDAVHLHNIYHQLSPSILGPLAERSIPIVMTLHDYKLACPTYRFLDRGEICEACLGGRFRQAALRRCNRGSFAASALNAFEMRVHTTLGLYGPVGVFLCPSRFLQGKMTAAGVFPDRLKHLPHFVRTEGVASREAPGTGVVYAGRLSHEKGVDVLIRAAARARVPLTVAGDGPALGELQDLAESLGLEEARFTGRMPPVAVQDLLHRSVAAVLPARWYENQPLAVLDAFAAAVPAVGSDLGGIPELIDEGVDGFLVPPGAPEPLADRLHRLVSTPELSLQMGLAGRRKAETSFAIEHHLAGVDDAYRRAAHRVNSGPNGDAR